MYFLFSMKTAKSLQVVGFGKIFLKIWCLSNLILKKDDLCSLCGICGLTYLWKPGSVMFRNSSHCKPTFQKDKLKHSMTFSPVLFRLVALCRPREVVGDDKIGSSPWGTAPHSNQALTGPMFTCWRLQDNPSPPTKYPATTALSHTCQREFFLQSWRLG